MAVSPDVHGDIGRCEARTGGRERHLAYAVEPRERVANICLQGGLVGIRIGGEGERYSAATTESGAQGAAARADRQLHGLDTVDVAQGVFDGARRHILSLEAGAQRQGLANGQSVLAAVADEVRLHARQQRYSAAEHQKCGENRDRRALQSEVDDRQVPLLQAGGGIEFVGAMRLAAGAAGGFGSSRRH